MLEASRAFPEDIQDNSISSICVVTEDLLGRAGRTEVSMAALAETFSSQGKQVTLLWITPFDKPEGKKAEDLKNKFYDQYLVNLEILTETIETQAPLASPEKRSVALYQYLKSKSFDAVYFALEGGIAYYTLLAKETNVFFNPRPRLIVVGHSPIAWQSEADRYFLGQLQQLSVAHMERCCAEMADQLICVSGSLLNWMTTQGWKISPNVEVLPAMLPSEWRIPIDDDEGQQHHPIRELVLLAGPSYREGLTLFCDTLDILAQKDIAPDLRITTFGPFAKILGEHTGGMVLRRSRQWPFDLRITPNLTFREILEYAKTRNALAVIPAIDSAVGYWITACVEHGIPYVGTAVGANLDAPHGEAPNNSLAAPTPRALADQIETALAAATLPAPQDISYQRQEAWLSALAKLEQTERRSIAPASQQDGEPLVSIVMAHYDRPHYLLQAIAAVEAQTYTSIELIIVDDGSKLPQSHTALDRLEEKFKERNWKILRKSNKYLGAARNAGVREARGEHILFVDDDNALFPDAVRTYVQAMKASGADICISFHRVFYGQTIPKMGQPGTIRYLPLGGALDLGLLYNVFGDANAMMRRSVFDTIGYQLEDYGFTCQDWEFFARATMAGLKLRVIPEPLYWYRSDRQGMYRSSHWYSNRLPILAAFKANDFRGLEHIFHLLLSKHALDQEANGFRENLIHSPSDWRYLELSKQEANSAKALELLAATAASEGRVNTSLSILGKIKGFKFDARMVERLSAQPSPQNPFHEFSAGLTAERKLGHRELQMMEIGSTAAVFNSPLSYVEAPDRFFLEAKDSCISIAVLPRECPPATLSISATVSLEQDSAVPTDFLIMATPSHLDPLVAVQSASETAVEGSSGWCSVMYGYTSKQIEATVSTPGEEATNLIVAVRSNVKNSATLGCFSKVTIRNALGHHAGRRPRLGPPPAKRRARAFYREELNRAALVTRYSSDLPLLMLSPKDEGLFLRPHKQGPVVAVISYGFPAFARRLIGKVEISHEEAGPFEFAIGLAWPQSTLDWSSEQPRNCLAFSGWVKVADRFVIHDVAASLTETTKSSLSIYLAIRLPKNVSPSPANAFWRKLVISWDD